MHQRRTISPLPQLAAITLLLSACAAFSPPADIPEPLKVPNAAPLEIVGARGVQIYECRAKRESSGQPSAATEWAFVAPEADLFDAKGNQIGRHYAGPHWEANDGSRVVGTVATRSNAPSASDIPWLLLNARSTGKVGRFASVTHIQRIATRGGIAPATGCDTSTIGTTARVPYKSDYVMLSTR